MLVFFRFFLQVLVALTLYGSKEFTSCKTNNKIKQRLPHEQNTPWLQCTVPLEQWLSQRHSCLQEQCVWAYWLILIYDMAHKFTFIAFTMLGFIVHFRNAEEITNAHLPFKPHHPCVCLLYRPVCVKINSNSPTWVYYVFLSLYQSLFITM